MKKLPIDPLLYEEMILCEDIICEKPFARQYRRFFQERKFLKMESWLNLRRPALIHFFGPDGSGKTTQVDILLRQLLSKGVPAKKGWIRSPHTLAFVFAMLFLKIGLYRTSSTQLGKLANNSPLEKQPINVKGQSTNLPPWDIRINPWRKVSYDRDGNAVVCERIPAVNSNSFLRWFWAVTELVSVLPLIFYRVYFKLLLGYSVVAERCIVDTVTTIAYFVDDVEFIRSPVARVLINCIPRHTMFIFLDSDYDTLLKRRSFNVEVKRFIEFQRKAYYYFSHSFGALAIDTSMFSVEDTATMISQYVALAPSFH